MRQLAFENLIGAFLETLTSKTIIEADGNGTRPVLPYITMKVFTGVKVGEPCYSKADGLGDQKITFPVDYSVSLQGYGVGAVEGLEDIQENLQKASTIEFCSTEGIGIRSSGNIQDISGLLDATIEKRYSLDLKFGTMRLVNNGSGYIDKIIGVGAVDDITIEI